MLRPILALTVFAILSCAGINPAHALEAIGHVTVIEGEAFVERRGEPVFRLAEEDQIFEGDMVETTPDSTAHMVLDDGTEITLDGDTAMKITLHSYKEDAGDKNRSLMDLVHGSALYLSGKISKGGGSSSIKTNYGSLGIRGTEFWVGERMTDMGKGLGVFVDDGEVEVRNWSGSVRVGKGLGTNVFGHGKGPSKPRAWGKGGIDKTFGKLKQRRAEMKERRKERIQKNIEKLQQKHQERQEQKQERRDQFKDKFQNGHGKGQSGKDKSGKGKGSKLRD